MAAPHEEASRPPNFDDPKWLPEYDQDFLEARVLTVIENGASRHRFPLVVVFGRALRFPSFSSESSSEIGKDSEH